MLAGCTFLRLSRPCSHSAAADVTAGKIYVPMKGEKLHKTMIGAILLQILLIFGNAVFASAEIAVISMNDAKLKRMTHDGDKRARKLTALTEQPARFLATIQVAITLAGLMGGAFAAENFAGPLVGLLMSLGVPVPENVLHSVSVVLITLALTYFSLVFGELVPKRIAMKKPDSMALGMSGMLFGVWKLCKPVVWLLTFSTNQILRLLGVDPEEEDEVVTEEEIRMMLAEGREQGTIRPEESQMIQNVFEFDDTPAEQAGTHRKDVVFLHMEDEDAVWDQTILESRFTYFPVCRENRDNVIGILDTRDYFRLKDRSRKSLMEHAVDRPFLVPETMRAHSLLSAMKKERKYFAVLLDEYGSVTGIVTLHDLVEELVGDLETEDEEERPKEIRQISENCWRIQGSAPLDEVEDALKLVLPREDYDTFNGYVWGLIDRIPADGEHFEVQVPGLKIQIKNVKTIWWTGPWRKSSLRSPGCRGTALPFPRIKQERNKRYGSVIYWFSGRASGKPGASCNDPVHPGGDLRKRVDRCAQRHRNLRDHPVPKRQKRHHHERLL